MRILSIIIVLITNAFTASPVANNHAIGKAIILNKAFDNPSGAFIRQRVPVNLHQEENTRLLNNKYDNDTIVKINYKKQVYGSKDNLVKNSNFIHELASWDNYKLDSQSKNSLLSVENISGKNWLKINCSDKASTDKQGYVEQIVNIPESLKNSILEFSFDVFGYFQKVVINDQKAGNYNIVISAAKPERLYMYVRPNGKKTISIKLFRCMPGQEIPNQNLYFGNIQLTKAKYNYNTFNTNFPKTGLNLQLARWISDWKIDYQEKYLQKISKEITPFIRVWLSSELLTNYKDKPNPKKRDTDQSFLSENFNNLTVGKIPTEFNDNIKKVDWFFKRCSELGIKLHVTLGPGFTDGKGGPHPTLNVPGLYELLDTDITIQKATTAYFTKVVRRYKSYKNIIGYELVNEGYFTWRSIYAGYNLNAPFSTVRSSSFAGYKAWERQTYAAIKKEDPTRPIILDLLMDESSLHYLATDDICDWYCPSFYGGKLKLEPTNIYNDSFKLSENSSSSFGSINNGYKLIAYTDNGNVLPDGIEAGKIYYIVNFSDISFQISNIKNGNPIHISGGKGSFYFYSPDGSLIDVDSPVLDRLKDFRKFVYFSEFGAPIIGQNLLYRDEKINAAYINKIKNLAKKYHIASVIGYDEHNLFFDRNFTSKQTANQLSSPKVKE